METVTKNDPGYKIGLIIKIHNFRPIAMKLCQNDKRMSK